MQVVPGGKVCARLAFAFGSNRGPGHPSRTHEGSIRKAR